jgi:threonine dehydrogenase-like Zn-dependent dehydrogenase
MTAANRSVLVAGAGPIGITAAAVGGKSEC